MESKTVSPVWSNGVIRDRRSHTHERAYRDFVVWFVLGMFIWGCATGYIVWARFKKNERIQYLESARTAEQRTLKQVMNENHYYEKVLGIRTKQQ